MLGGIGGRRKRGRQRMRWLDGTMGRSPDSADALALAYYFRRKLAASSIGQNSLYSSRSLFRH